MEPKVNNAEKTNANEGRVETKPNLPPPQGGGGPQGPPNRFKDKNPNNMRMRGKKGKMHRRGGGKDKGLSADIRAGLPSDEELEREAQAIQDLAPATKSTEPKLDVGQLQKMNMSELHELARKEGIEEYTGLKKQDLIFKILKEKVHQDGLMYGEGVLEILPDGFGFLRSPRYSYYPSPDDIYISPSQIRRFGIRPGE